MTRTRVHRHAHGDAGFSMAEVVVSFGLFAIVATSASYVLTNGVKSSHATQQRVAAANIAQANIADAQAVHAGGNDPLALDYVAESGKERYTVLRTVSSCDAATNQITVAVVVSQAASNKFLARSDTILACTP